jgi:hypothetical protein
MADDGMLLNSPSVVHDFVGPNKPSAERWNADREEAARLFCEGVRRSHRRHNNCRHRRQNHKPLHVDVLPVVREPPARPSRPAAILAGDRSKPNVGTERHRSRFFLRKRKLVVSRYAQSVFRLVSSPFARR